MMPLSSTCGALLAPIPPLTISWLLAHARALAAVVVGLAPCAAQEALDPRLRPVRERIVESVRTGHHPSVAIAVGLNDAVVWEEAFGMADREGRRPATTRTPYPLGSLAKSLTAVGIMVLVERGDIDLDSPVQRYLGEEGVRVRVGDDASVTVRSLINMRAGVPHGWHVLPATEGAREPDALEFVRDHCPVVFEPGKGRLYSNLSYGILQAVIERVSGVSYASFMQSAVFGPLGMTEARPTFDPRQERVAATRYRAGGLIAPHSLFVPAAAAGAYASVHDLLLYGTFFAGAPMTEEAVLSAAGRATMVRRSAAGDAVGGLGFGAIRVSDDLTWVVTNGGVAGATSMLTIIPERRLVVAVLTNTRHRPSSADRIADDVVEALLPGFGEQRQTALRALPRPDAPRAYEPGEALTGTWSGSMVGPGGERAVTLVIPAGESPSLNLAGVRRPLQNPRANDRQFAAASTASLPLGDDLDAEAAVALDLRLVDGELGGYAMATIRQRGISSRLPVYVGLTRQ